MTHVLPTRRISIRALESGTPNSGDDGWWWTPAGIATRYGVVAALFAIALLFFGGGYLHARRRIRKGQQPLAYHRWMVKQPTYAYPARQPVPYARYGDPNSVYMMEPPPPAYQNAEVPPPVYAPPPGASKAMADQNFRETHRVGEASGSSGVGGSEWSSTRA